MGIPGKAAGSFVLSVNPSAAAAAWSAITTCVAAISNQFTVSFADKPGQTGAQYLFDVLEVCSLSSPADTAKLRVLTTPQAEPRARGMQVAQVTFRRFSYGTHTLEPLQEPLTLQ